MNFLYFLSLHTGWIRLSQRVMPPIQCSHCTSRSGWLFSPTQCLHFIQSLVSCEQRHQTLDPKRAVCRMFNALCKKENKKITLLKSRYSKNKIKSHKKSDARNPLSHKSNWKTDESMHFLPVPPLTPFVAIRNGSALNTSRHLHYALGNSLWIQLVSNAHSTVASYVASNSDRVDEIATRSASSWRPS